MLSAAVILFVALLVFLFLFDFGNDLKPGVMTKVKTLLTHFQVSQSDSLHCQSWPERLLPMPLLHRGCHALSFCQICCLEPATRYPDSQVLSQLATVFTPSA